MDPRSERNLRVQRERKFSPHHVLLGVAHMAFESAEKKEDGWFYHELISITFTALALEALANSFGECVVERWTDFESASPMAKLRVIARELGLQEASLDKDGVLVWLVRFRNKVAHAKPELVRFDALMTKEELVKIQLEAPKSGLESEVSLSNAKRALAAVEAVFDLLCEKTPQEKLDGLLGDGFSGTVTRT